MKTAGLWPWKSAPTKKCVTTYLPNAGALKIDGAFTGKPIPARDGPRTRDPEYGGAPESGEGAASAAPEPPAVRILVVVAIIQAATLRSEVEGVSWATAFDPGLAGPEPSVDNRTRLTQRLGLGAKGKRAKIPAPPVQWPRGDPSPPP